MQPARVSDSAGVRHSFEWDAASQPAVYQAPANPAHGGGQSATRWRYDKERKLQSITRPGGQQVAFSYDDAARLSATTADGRATRRIYNAQGQLQALQQDSQRLDITRADGLPVGQRWSGPLQAAITAQLDSRARPTRLTVSAGGQSRQLPVSIDAAGRASAIGPLSLVTFNQAIMDMNANRQRLPTAGRIGGIVNNQFSVASRFFDFPSEWTGYNTYDCYDQWKYVQERLNELKPTLTDQWSFNDYPTFGHMSGEAVSNNPNDRKIRMDPWRNYIRIK